METLKICNICNKSKLINEFGLRKNSTDGHKGKCKSCEYEYKKEWAIKNKDRLNKKSQIYRENNKEKINKQTLELYYKNKDRYNIAKRKYSEDNKDKIIKYRKKYYLENKERLDYLKKKYYKENKERMSHLQKISYIENKEYILKRNMEYQKNNKEKIKKYKSIYRETQSSKISKRTSNHKRNTKIRINNDKTINKKSLEELFHKQNGKCYYCNCQLDFNVKFSVHLDHYIPIIEGGLHSINNVVWSCKTCNLLKRSKMPSEPLKI